MAKVKEKETVKKTDNKKTTNRSRLAIGAVVLAIAALWMLYNMRSSDEERVNGAVRWASFNDGMATARAEHKMVMVDVYTDWCVWCKKLDKEVYPDPRVSSAIASQFVPIKVNAESGSTIEFNGVRMTEEQFARQAGVTGYPTVLFLDDQGKVVTTLPGFLPADRFVRVLQYVSEHRYREQSLDDFLSRNS